MDHAPHPAEVPSLQPGAPPISIPSPVDVLVEPGTSPTHTSLAPTPKAALQSPIIAPVGGLSPAGVVIEPGEAPTPKLLTPTPAVA